MERSELMNLLQSQLAFLQRGGYRPLPQSSWRTPLMFEDSPTCLNFRQPSHPYPCVHCGLMHFVPLRRHSARIPCRYIPLNAEGETVDGLYRYASQQELVATVRAWLLRTIQKLDEEQVRGESLKQNSELPLGAPPPNRGETKLPD